METLLHLFKSVERNILPQIVMTGEHWSKAMEDFVGNVFNECTSAIAIADGLEAAKYGRVQLELSVAKDFEEKMEKLCNIVLRYK